MCRLIGLAVFTFCLTAILVPVQLAARDDGRFANSPLKPWFDRLASGKGLCCSFADGFSVQDVDWDTHPNFFLCEIIREIWVRSANLQSVIVFLTQPPSRCNHRRTRSRRERVRP